MWHFRHYTIRKSLKNNTPTSSIPGVISPDQNLEAITRMRIQTLYSLFRYSSYVSYDKSLVDGSSLPYIVIAIDLHLLVPL